jgi:hypothetical protein
MGLLGRAGDVANGLAANGTSGNASKPVSGKVIIPKENLGVLKKRISEYQKVYRIFGCILLEDRAQESGKTDLYEKLTKVTGNMGSAGPVNSDHALILLPSEMDRELIAHRLSKSLNAEPILSFRAVSPEYVINRINTMS